GMSDMPYTFMRDGILAVDRRAFVYYMALGNSPAMVAKNVGVGSQYLWTYKDAKGNFLDGAKNYRLHVPAKIPINNFWSVLVYDSLSRSELRNRQPFPSVSQYILIRKSTPTVQYTSISVPKCRKARRRTGSGPFPKRDGSQYFASTDRSNLSSTRPGS